MTIPAATNDQIVTPSQATEVSDGMPFADYERVRRGEPKAEGKPISAPAPSKDQAEQKPASESDTEETESTESEENESEESPESDDESETTEKEDKPAPKKKGGFARRIDKLNAQKTAAQQEAEYWKREALKNATGSKVDAPKAGSKAAAVEGKPNPDSFDTHAEYVEALTDWKTDQKFKEREQKAERAKLETEQQDKVRAYVERMESFKAKAEDFDDVVDAVGDIPVSPAIREVILSSDNGPELVYELAKNREEYARLCKLSPLAAAREMGKLEARIAARTSETKKPETNKLTKAPKPLEPVKSDGRGAVKKSISDPNISFAEYEQIRREQMKRARN